MGVLALQGAFAEHLAALERLGAEARPVRLPQDLSGLEGLIIPGGESTTMARLLAALELYGPVKGLARDGMPMWGTCAGLILLAKDALGLREANLGVMDVTVRRNAYGRQVDSFEADLEVPALGPPPFRAVFIRSPRIEEVGSGVEALACLPGGEPVAVRQGQLLGTTFHPELTPDLRFHQLFLRQGKKRASRAIREKPAGAKGAA